MRHSRMSKSRTCKLAATLSGALGTLGSPSYRVSSFAAAHVSDIEPLNVEGDLGTANGWCQSDQSNPSAAQAKLAGERDIDIILSSSGQHDRRASQASTALLLSWSAVKVQRVQVLEIVVRGWPPNICRKH